MSSSYTYMLRKTLPLWKGQETVDEVHHYCTKYNIDEVMFIVDVEEFSHGLPTIDYIKSYVPLLEYAKEKLNKSDIKFSINPWVTVGHEDRGRDMSQIHPDMTFQVDFSGLKAKSIACPLSESWQEWICKVYQIYAALEPNVLWIEDDFRMFWHLPIKYGCFCDLHLAQFSEIVGQQVTREGVIDAIFKDGTPHPWRAKWLDMNGDIMVDLAEKLEKAVHQVSNKVKIGLMCSGPTNHAASGRKWKELCRALFGDHVPIARPSLGAYNEYLPMELIMCMDIGRSTVACLPDETIICPEVENFNFTTFSKSYRFTRLQIGLTALLGYKNVTLNLYDHLGSPISIEAGYMHMLKELKPIIDNIIEGLSESEEIQELGVGIAHLQRGAHITHLKQNGSYTDLNPNCMEWSVPLQACGIPVTFGTSYVKAVTGQFFRAKTHDEILDILSKGVLLDSSAAFVLQELGYSDYIGIDTIEMICKKDVLMSAEELIHESFQGSPAKYMSLTTLTEEEMYAKMEMKKGAEVISYVVNADRERIMPCMTAYENQLGGRVVIHALDLSKGFIQGINTGFLNRYRIEQLGVVVQWLSKGKVPYQTISGAYHYTLCRQYEDFDFIGIANLTSDTLRHIEIKINDRNKLGNIKTIEVSKKDEWETVTFLKGENSITIMKPLEYKDFIGIKIYE